MRTRKTGGRLIESRDLAQEFQAKELSRRRMVQSVMLGAVGTWLGARGLAACGGTAMNPPTDGATPPADGATPPADAATDAATDVPPPPPAHLVGMGYHESDPAAAFAAALAETVGLGMIHRGDSVYLRVNSNSGDPYPYSTSPDRLVQLGGMLRDLGVTDLRIGDRSFWGDADTAGNLAANGIAAAATALGTTAVAYDDNVDWMTLPAAMVPNWVGTVRLPVPVVTATHIINMGCVKTHFIATVTMSLKLSLGLVHATDRRRAGNLDSHVQARLWPQIAQINKGFTPSLNVLDGYRALISGGPTMRDRPPGAPATFTTGVTGDPRVVIASTDRIAADVTGIAVLRTLAPTYEYVRRYAPFRNPQIVAAVAAGGLGISGPDAYDLAGPTVPMLDQYRTLAVA